MNWLRPLAAIVVVSAVFSASTDVAAQEPPKIHRIAILGNDDTPPWDGLRQGLRELGYVEGTNVRFEWRWSGGDTNRFPMLARELAALAPDIIVTSGTQAALAAASATNSIPIVMALSQYPEEVGLVKSLARPGGNVTGLSTYAPQLSGKKLELLRETAPDVVRIALLWSPDSLSQRLQYQELLAAAAAAGVSIHSIELKGVSDVGRALAAAKAGGAQALMVIGNPVTFRSRRQITDFALRNKLPSVYEERLFALAGGLMSYGPSFTALFHRAATYVDRILKGAKPADLPVEQPVRFELVINRKTARSLGVELPPSVVLRADEIID